MCWWPTLRLERVVPADSCVVLCDVLQCSTHPQTPAQDTLSLREGGGAVLVHAGEAEALGSTRQESQR